MSDLRNAISDYLDGISSIENEHQLEIYSKAFLLVHRSKFNDFEPLSKEDLISEYSLSRNLDIEIAEKGISLLAKNSEELKNTAISDKEILDTYKEISSRKYL